MSEDIEEIESIKTNLHFCLIHLAKMNNISFSEKSLVAGLPIKNNKMEPLHFLRALKRLQLKGHITQKTLREIRHVALPVILILKNDTACIVEKIESEKWFIRTSDGKLTAFDTATLFPLYTLHCIEIEKHITEKNEALTLLKDNWLFSALCDMKSIYYRVILASFFTNLLGLLVPLFSMNVYDRVVPNYALDTLWVLSIGIILSLVFDFVLKIIKTHYVDIAGKKVDENLSSKLLEKILGTSLNNRGTSIGALSNHVKELETIREFFSSVTLMAVVDFPFAILFLAIITLVGGVWFLVISLLGIAITLIFSWILQHIISQYAANGFATATQKNAFLVETIMGLETIKAFRAEGKVQKDWEDISAKHSEYGSYSNFFSSMAMNLSGTLNNIIYVVFVIVGVFHIYSQQLSMGGLIACTILGSRAIQPFASAVNVILRLNYVLIAYRAINTIMSMSFERSEQQTYFPKKEYQGAITFKDVVFAYGGQENKALNNVSFHIQPGDHVAVIGKIGSGKTTLQKLMLGFYKPESGSILYDTMDLHQLDPHDVRDNIGYLSQDIYLFSGSILDNITLGRQNVSPESLEKALTYSGAIHFIKKHPLGLNMPVGEGGRFLSGGQKQIVGITRAMLNDPSILLFDEPTTMMDQQSEAEFIHNFKAYIDNKTFIFVSHNPSMLQLATKILFIEDGYSKFFGSTEDFVKLINANAASKV
jgi:ATP-binding cassette subfamily C protein LapB